LVKIDGRSDYSIQLASFWMNKAVVLMNIGDIPNAVSLFDHGIDIYERMVNLEGHHELSSSLADIYANKAAALISQIAVNQEASLSVVTLYTRAIAIYEHLVNNEDRRDLADRLANLYMGTGIALVEQQNVPAAIDLYDRAIALYDRLITVEGHSEFSGNTAHVLLYAVKAEANMKQNKFRNALTLYDKAIELFNNAHNLSVRNGVDDIFKDVFKNRLYCLTQLNEQV
jgi:tetratricopeptide (TPR) repeat protein